MASRMPRERVRGPHVPRRGHPSVALRATALPRVCVMKRDDVAEHGGDFTIAFGSEPAPVPAPFAALLADHLSDLPNSSTGQSRERLALPEHASRTSPRPQHGDDAGFGPSASTFLGARTRALRVLVTEAPPPVVATMLGYSHQITQKHAGVAAGPYSAYAAAISRVR